MPKQEYYLTSLQKTWELRVQSRVPSLDRWVNLKYRYLTEGPIVDSDTWQDIHSLQGSLIDLEK
jgi:hypothetical protein